MSLVRRTGFVRRSICTAWVCTTLQCVSAPRAFRIDIPAQRSLDRTVVRGFCMVLDCNAQGHAKVQFTRACDVLAIIFELLRRCSPALRCSPAWLLRKGNICMHQGSRKFHTQKSDNPAKVAGAEKQTTSEIENVDRGSKSKTDSGRRAAAQLPQTRDAR